MRRGSPFKQTPPPGISITAFGGTPTGVAHPVTGLMHGLRPAFTAASWGAGAGFAPGAAAIPANIGSATWAGTMAPAGVSGTAMAPLQPFASQGMSAAGTGGFLMLAMMLGMSHMAKARRIMAKINAAKRREYEARAQMNRYKNIYENTQVVNPYSNLKKSICRARQEC